MAHDRCKAALEHFTSNAVELSDGSLPWAQRDDVRLSGRLCASLMC